ncbi:hypothetical protein MRO49_15600, partial [Escherichia coli]|nr:hypothetical protein [Escherichia coli]
KIGPDPRNFNQRVSLGRNDLLIRTFHNFPPELSSGGDKYFHLRNYSEYSEYTSGFFLSLMIFIKS